MRQGFFEINADTAGWIMLTLRGFSVYIFVTYFLWFSSFSCSSFWNIVSFAYKLSDDVNHDITYNLNLRNLNHVLPRAEGRGIFHENGKKSPPPSPITPNGYPGMKI